MIGEIQAPSPEQIARRIKADREIDAAAREVGRASDRYLQAKFSGRSEHLALTRLDRASAALAKVMRRHGRMP